MKPLINFILGVTLLSCTLSCAERTVCAAYQSAFIHDKSTLDRHFSYFGEDSLPKNQLTASKNKYLIIDKVPYKKKLRSFNTVPMKTIYPVLDDSTLLAGDVQMLTEMDVVDSVALDSAVQNELPWKEQFNVEQEFYLHYFNDILVYPEERAQAELDKNGKANQQKQPFFKNLFGGLFKKKNKEVPEEEGRVEDELEDQEGRQKGLKGLFGKKDKSVSEDEIGPTEAVQEPDDDTSDEVDDGEDDF